MSLRRKLLLVALAMLALPWAGWQFVRQMEVLHRLGCSLMQGFLFSKPLPPDELERWIAQTVLPRKAPWITQADGGQDLARGQR